MSAKSKHMHNHHQITCVCQTLSLFKIDKYANSCERFLVYDLYYTHKTQYISAWA